MKNIEQIISEEKKIVEKFLLKENNVPDGYISLLSKLNSCIDLAEKIAQHVIDNPDEENGFTGGESSEVGSKLEAIYAAFATGDRADRSHNGEFFKHGGFP